MIERIRAFIEAYPTHVQKYTVGVAIIVFLSITIYHLVKNKGSLHSLPLDRLLLRVFAGSSIPTGFLLLLGAFNMQLLAKSNDINIYIAAAGLTLLYLSFKELFNTPQAGVGGQAQPAPVRKDDEGDTRQKP